MDTIFHMVSGPTVESHILRVNSDDFINACFSMIPLLVASNL